MSESEDRYKEALKEQEKILRKVAPHKVKEAKLMRKATRFEVRLRKVREKIVKIERDRDLEGVSRTIVELAPRAKRILAEAGKFEAKL